MILVVGGTGTLGREIVRRLLEAGAAVRVLTRDTTRARGLPPTVEVAIGDLRDSASLSTAVRGCRVVVSAAHGFLGPGKPSPEAVDREGNRALVGAAVEAGVSHFVLVSVQGAAADHPMSLFRAKHAAEEHLRASGLSFTIVRATAFMETWLNIISSMIETKGHAVVFGPGTNLVNFVSVRDVAATVALAAAAALPPNQTLEISGPENLGFVTLAEEILRARGSDEVVRHVPLAALRALSVLARPFAPGFARQTQAAVLMNTSDMKVPAEAALRARPAGVPTTRLSDLLAQARTT
jgi:uncharacterized protein YbjT (DUF2867 family)